MSFQPSPYEILQTLLPHLRIAAGYAQQIQNKIISLPAKDAGDNFLSAALTDADLSIQTLVEVALLGTYPHFAFYGEEYAQSRNTKYFTSTALGTTKQDYLITLDPIDGTKYYLDGFNNYQIILSILNREQYEAVIAISPAQNCYYYTLKGRGVFKGDLNLDLDRCQPLEISNPRPNILLGWGMAHLKPALEDKYRVIDIENCYSASEQFPNYNGIFSGDLIGWITKRGKFIDSAALAFMAQENGCLVTSLNGLPLTPLHACKNYSYDGAIVANSAQLHQDLLTACQQLITK
ncbi:inositol monophosphatase family protein [Waterburya agarophytonicola K14]|uniref:Inositol monophosphatase family protein n=1 Tax=Waterburya agarophytonicola KI4 TaxID=2874699 RepID=A0A964BUZ7_9CYAN|nr:inositol monophosphatase family protein [Waterburya agarophytonicola]MCC0178651.1 inositol monophosphatase family protein [Waterburya agarophytonicola KI4]